MKTNQLYKRLEDMSPDGFITVRRDDDGDVILGMVARRFRTAPLLSLSVEYCVDGGRSPHTYRALQALAEAIERDNLEHPIVQPEPEGGEENGSSRS